MGTINDQQDQDSELLLSDEEAKERSRGSQLSWSSQISESYVKVKQSWVVEEAVQLFKLAIPIVLTQFFQQLLFFISVIFVGHISGTSLELDAAALALSFVNVTGVSVVTGLSTAADTLCSQTYGFKNYKRVGIILQRGILILTIAMFPILVVWLNSESILLLLQQPPCVARLTGQFAQIFCLALPAIIVYTMLQKYLQAQSIVWMFILVGILTNIISAALHAILIFPADLGIIGAAISLAVAFTSAPVIVVVYVWARRLHKQTWGGWSWNSLTGWGQFAKLGVPGLLMTSIVWWSYEIPSFVTGSINKTQLGINAVLISILSVVFMMPFGLGIAAGVRVGNALGAGRPLKAKRVTYTAIGIIFCIATVTSTVLLTTRKEIGKLFTKDEKVIEGVAKAMYVTGPMMFFDLHQGTISGILQGSGRQSLGAVVNFCSYYIIGLPIGIVLALVADLGTLGMWTGLTIGDIIQAITFVIVIFKTNWEYQSERATRNAQDTVQRSDSHRGEEEESGSIASEDSSSSGSNSQVQDRDCLPLHTLQDSQVGESTIEKNDHSSAAIEEIPLVSFEDDKPIPEAEHHHQSQKLKPTLKLLLYRSTFFIVGVMLLVAGGVASQYHPSADYSDCDGSNSSDNFNVSSTYYYYSHTAASSADPQTHSVAFSVVTTSIPYLQPTGVVAATAPSLHPSNTLF